MNNNLLDQLKPIILPDYAVSFWPLAIGWWLLLALVIFLIAGFVFLRPVLKLRKQQKQIRENTLQILNVLYSDCMKESDASLALQGYLQKSNDVFKRVVHTNTDLAKYSHLAGKNWVALIDAIDPGCPFATLYGDNLYAARCNQKINLDELHRWACAWIAMANKRAHLISKKLPVQTVPEK